VRSGLGEWAESVDQYLRALGGGVQLYDFAGSPIINAVGQADDGGFTYLTSHVMAPMALGANPKELNVILIEIYASDQAPAAAHLARKIIEKFPTLAKSVKEGDRFPDKIHISKVLE
jgi:hypothetical protein